MKFKKKPVIVDAFCPGLDGGIVPDWFNDMLENGTIIECLDSDGYDIHTLEGTMHASPGDYIIMGVRGEAYPCKPDIFTRHTNHVKEKAGGVIPPVYHILPVLQLRYILVNELSVLLHQSG